MKCFFSGLLGTLISIIIIVFFVIPSYCDYRARIGTSEWIRLIHPVMQKIEEKTLERKTINNVGVGLKIPSTLKNITYANVSTNGIIFLQGGLDGQVIIFIPALHANQFTWKCIGGSAKTVPLKCRSNIP